MAAKWMSTNTSNTTLDFFPKNRLDKECKLGSCIYFMHYTERINEFSKELKKSFFKKKEEKESSFVTTLIYRLDQIIIAFVYKANSLTKRLMKTQIR